MTNEDANAMIREISDFCARLSWNYINQRQNMQCHWDRMNVAWHMHTDRKKNRVAL